MQGNFADWKSSSIYFIYLELFFQYTVKSGGKKSKTYSTMITIPTTVKNSQCSDSTHVYTHLNF